MTLREELENERRRSHLRRLLVVAGGRLERGLVRRLRLGGLDLPDKALQLCVSGLEGERVLRGGLGGSEVAEGLQGARAAHEALGVRGRQAHGEVRVAERALCEGGATA